MYRFILLCLTLALLLGGCYSKPVRHLASDAGLLEVGVSTRQDVLRYLGEPDGQRMVAPNVQEYIYFAERKNIMGRTPLLGSMVGSEGYETLVITLTGDLVTGSEFRTFLEKDKDLLDDFTWDEVK